jgi:HJR/Mrr/RecB family endonuclease
VDISEKGESWANLLNWRTHLSSTPKINLHVLMKAKLTSPHNERSIFSELVLLLSCSSEKRADHKKD